MVDIVKAFPCETEVTEVAANLIKKINDRLADDFSRYVFQNRIMYSLTDDLSYIRNIIDSSKDGKKFLNTLKQLRNDKEFFIYGAGVNGKRLCGLYPEIFDCGFIDKNEKGVWDGHKIYLLDEIKEHLSEYAIIISNSFQYCEIKQKLIELGADEENVITLLDWTKKIGSNLYFEEGIIPHKNLMGAFVDVGCFDATDTINFSNWCGNEQIEAIAIEADPDNYEICKERLNKYKNVEVLNIGAGKERSVLMFSAGGNTDSKFSDKGKVKIQTEKLDDVLKDKKVSYLKMDVEGFEENTLLGAEKVIRNNHPIMAISIYHKREDIWNLPRIILDFYPEYKLYLRHYSAEVTDTVLYAIP